MPGAGRIVAISQGSAGTSQGGVNTALANLVSGGGLGIDGKVVIRWGGAGAPVDATNPSGFNLGSNATFLFGAISPGSAVLNIDASGNPSQIYGSLVATASPIAAVAPLASCGACAYAPAIFVANANGIVVGAGGRIVAPAGVGLIGADMDTSVSINDFIGNNGWVSPDAPTLGTSYLSIGALPTAGPTPGQVTIAGSINGDASTNTPAQYILVTGNNVDVLNTGNLFGTRVLIQAGVVPTAGAAAVGGADNVVVNRLWNVDSGEAEVNGALGATPGWLTLSGPAGNGNITNEGSIAASGFDDIDYLALQGAGNIRSGIDGSADPTIGLFSAPIIRIDSMADTASVSLFNIVSGYGAAPTFQVRVNSWATNADEYPEVTPTYANVLIKALTPGDRPSSISTLTQVDLHGRDITVASTINHKLASEGVTQITGGLLVNAIGSLTMSADFGAADSVTLRAGHHLTVTGNGVTNTKLDTDCCGFYVVGGDGVTTVSGNLTAVSPNLTGAAILFDVTNKTVVSGALSTAAGDVIFYNFGEGPGNATEITGNVNSAGTFRVTQGESPFPAPILVSGKVVANGEISIHNEGSALGNATRIAGAMTSLTDNVIISHRGQLTGMLETTGAITAAQTLDLYSDGNARIGPLNAADIVASVDGLHLEVKGPWAAGTATLYTPLATTAFMPDGTITAPVISLNGLHFQGVDAAGAAYAETADKPLAQFVTNQLNVALTGSINAPVAGNTNWLLNSLDIAPLASLAPVFVSVTANGGGFQAVNLRVLGNQVFDTGGTTTPFIGVPVTSGGFPAGGMQGNLGSQLIVQADGALTIVGTPTGSLTGPASAAQWPGGASFVAGTTLQLLTPFYNAWSVQSPPFGGVFFSAPTIALQGYIATSGTAWANFSQQPVTGNPTVYQIRALDTASFGFAATEAYVKNDYVNTVTGGPVCAQTGPTTWAVCQ